MNGLELAINAALGFASSFVLGAAKKYTGIADTAIGRFIKPFQPVVVLGLTVALPIAAKAIGVVPPDVADLASAPTATLLGVVGREVVARFFGSKRLPA